MFFHKESDVSIFLLLNDISNIFLFTFICTYQIFNCIIFMRNVKFKKINIKSDFKEQKTEFSFSASVKTRIFFLLVAAFRLYKTYKNFLYKEELQ